jgi:hypothetical protein
MEKPTQPTLDRAALERAMRAHGEEWYSLTTERCPHLFANTPVFIPSAQMYQMQQAVDAVERVVQVDGWMRDSSLPPSLSNLKERRGTSGVFFGYDFHLNEDGAHLIEINSNAGGAFLNMLLLDSQQDVELPGKTTAAGNLEQVFLEMFRNEWLLARGNIPLHSIAIVDQQPEGQYLYPEFILAKRMFEDAGITACIADPSALNARNGGLFLSEQKIDLLYNRLTDFSLQQHPILQRAYLDDSVVLTPDPIHYTRYADKHNLARLTDIDQLRALGVSETDIAVLQTGIPHTREVDGTNIEQWWQERKQWFFKPNNGYGSKGAYRGEKLTRRVFDEIMRGDYVAQRIAAPGELAVHTNDAGTIALKFDVRCYVYTGKIQLVAARLYQGQTTNFRTPGGGFAPVRVLG